MNVPSNEGRYPDKEFTVERTNNDNLQDNPRKAVQGIGSHSASGEPERFRKPLGIDPTDGSVTWRDQFMATQDSVALRAVVGERTRQKGRFSNVHDDQHTYANWRTLIDERVRRSTPSPHAFYRDMREIGALALAAMEAQDRAWSAWRPYHNDALPGFLGEGLEWRLDLNPPTLRRNGVVLTEAELIALTTVIRANGGTF